MPSSGRALIVADIEGIAGVDDQQRDLVSGTPGFAHSCQLMTEEVAAATRGLAASGAEDVIVIDAHGGGHNIIREQLPSPARFLDEPGVINQLRAAIDLGVDAAVLLGFHALAGTQGFIPHSFHVDTRSWINGIAVGEPSILALHFARHGIPVLLNAGDQYTLEQTAEVAPGIPRLQTKTATSPWTATSRDPAKVQAEIEERCAEGWTRRGELKVEPAAEPVEMVLQARNRVGYQLVACIPGTSAAERVNAVRFTGSWDEVFDFFIVANTVVSFLSYTGRSYYFGPIEDGLVPRLSQLPGAAGARSAWHAWWFQPDWSGEGW